MKEDRAKTKPPENTVVTRPKVKLSDAPTRAKKIRTFLLLLLGNLIAYLPLCVFGGASYSVDSPVILLSGDWVHISIFIGAYRYIGALTYKIYSLLGHNPIGNSTPDIILFILLAAVGTTAFIYCLTDHLKIKGIASWIAIEFATLLTVDNVWFCEILAFPESIFLTGVGLVFCFAALIVFMRRRSVISWILFAVLLLCAIATYQQFLSVFVIFIIAIIGAELTADSRCRAKDVFFAYFKPAVSVLITGVVYFALGIAITKHFDIKGNDRAAISFSSVLENIKYFLTHQHSFLRGRGLFKTEILTAAFIAMGVLWFICLLIYAKKKKEYVKAGFILASYTAAYVSAYLPGLISTSHAARAMFALFSVFFLFSAGVVAKSPKKIICAVPVCILAVVLATNLFVIIRNGNNHRTQRGIDIDCAEQISQTIGSYEKTSKVTVKTIAYCYDEQREIERGESLFYYNFALEPILTVKSCRYEHGVKQIYTFTNVPEEIYAQYFAGKDWHEFNLEEQMIIIDDTAYLCVY